MKEIHENLDTKKTHRDWTRYQRVILQDGSVGYRDPETGEIF